MSNEKDVHNFIIISRCWNHYSNIMKKYEEETGSNNSVRMWRFLRFAEFNQNFKESKNNNFMKRPFDVFICTEGVKQDFKNNKILEKIMLKSRSVSLVFWIGCGDKLGEHFSIEIQIQIMFIFLNNFMKIF